MNGKVCVLKKNVYVVLFLFFVILFLAISRLVLESNQASNSRASEIKQSIQVLPTASPPTQLQQDSAMSFKAARNNVGDIELLGDFPRITGRPNYALYMKKFDGSLVYIDTFIGSEEELSSRITTFWTPQTKVSGEDVATSSFLLFEIK
ncbi:MAG: hypothetical protein V1922_05685 [bacterium]